MLKVADFIYKEIFFNGHLQSLGASGIVYISSLYIFKKHPTLDLLVLVYIIFQFIYLNDRYKGLSSDTTTNVRRTKHISKYVKQIPLVLLVFFFLIILLNSVFSNMRSLLFSFFIVLSGFLYPIYFKNLTKKIYLFKNLYVSLVFALMVVFPPIYYSTQVVNVDMFYFLLFFIFIESLVNQVVLDMKDTKSDKKQNLLTLPVIIGMSRTTFILRIHSLLAAFLFMYFAIFFELNTAVLYLVMVSLLINLLVVYMIKSSRKMGYVVTVSKFFIWFLIILILK